MSMDFELDLEELATIADALDNLPRHSIPVRNVLKRIKEHLAEVERDAETYNYDDSLPCGCCYCCGCSCDLNGAAPEEDYGDPWDE